MTLLMRYAGGAVDILTPRRARYVTHPRGERSKDRACALATSSPCLAITSEERGSKSVPSRTIN
jgi:hypothetical protein